MITTIVIRDPQLIATEINIIKEQTRNFVFSNSLEIGEKLTEAKQGVAHGEWGNWLEKYVDYSQSTAVKLMKLHEEYGNKSNSELITNLEYTKALALMGLPSEQREDFVKELDSTKLNTAEFKQAIKDKVRLEKELKDAQDAAEADRIANDEAISAANAESELLINNHNEVVLKLNGDLEAALKVSGETDTTKKLKAQLETAKKDLDASLKKAKELEEKLKKQPAPTKAAVKEVIPEATQLELDTLRKAKEDHAAELLKNSEEAAKQIAAMQEQLSKNNNIASIKVKVTLATMVDSFKALLAAVGEVTNPEENAKFKADIPTLFDRLKAMVV